MLPILTTFPRWEGKIKSAKEMMTNDSLPKQELMIKTNGYAVENNMIKFVSARRSGGNELEELLLEGYNFLLPQTVSRNKYSLLPVSLINSTGML